METVLRITILTNTGFEQHYYECRNWHVDKETGTLHLQGHSNMTNLAFARGYWVEVFEDGKGVKEVWPE